MLPSEHLEIGYTKTTYCRREAILLDMKIATDLQTNQNAVQMVNKMICLIFYLYNHWVYF